MNFRIYFQKQFFFIYNYIIVDPYVPNTSDTSSMSVLATGNSMRLNNNVGERYLKVSFFILYFTLAISLVVFNLFPISLRNIIPTYIISA